jgi:dimethylhistidine N-methyltransferase
LFNQITRHPDYYLTHCEIEILNTYKKTIATRMQNEKYFNLIELGPGEGLKTEILMKELLQHFADFKYMPIDISKTYLQNLHTTLKKHLPHLAIQGIHADYLSGLDWLHQHNECTNLVLFLGSSIGNFTFDVAETFLHDIAKKLNPGDYFLLGVDLRKDVHLLMQAYDDKDGITREFNLNLLQRINRELQADFDVSQFQHYATYNVYTGAMESYLLSLKQQCVTIKALNRCFYFDEIEPIHVEYSHKYLLKHIHELAHHCGFKVIADYTDKKAYFLDSLWQVQN